MAVMFSYRASDSFAHRASPVVKLVLMLGLAFCPWQVSLPVTILIALLIRLPLISHLKSIALFLLIAALILISNGYEDTLGFLAVILSSMIFTDTTDPYDMARSLRPVLGKGFALGISMTMAMVPMAMEVTHEARLARKARGERFIGRGYLSSVMSSLLDKSDDFALALRSRGIESQF